MNPLDTEIKSILNGRIAVSCYCQACGKEQPIDFDRYPGLTFREVPHKIPCPDCRRTGLHITIRPR